VPVPVNVGARFRIATLPVFCSMTSKGTDKPCATPPKLWLVGVTRRAPCRPLQVSPTSVVGLMAESDAIRKMLLRLFGAVGLQAIIQLKDWSRPSVSGVLPVRT
jgi:hypothetical protein